MYDSRVVFGERAVLLVEAAPLPGRVLLPGPGVTVRQRAEAAANPGARARVAAAAAGLGVRLAVQDQVDIPAEARLCPPTGGESARAAAVLELGAWRYRVGHCPLGPRLARLLAERPDELAPAPGAGAVVGDTLTITRPATRTDTGAGGPVRGPAAASQLGRTGGGNGSAHRDGRDVGPVTGTATPGTDADGGGDVGVVLAVPGGAAPADPGWANTVLDSVVARQRLISYLQAEQYRDIAALSAGYPGIHQFLASELALALHVTDTEAARLLGDAEHLRDKTPGTLAALSAGLIDEPKAAAIVRGTATCTPEVAREVEQRVLPQASSITVVAVRRRTGRAVIAVDPDGAAQRHRRARADRYVSRRPEPDGMASMVIHAPAPDIATIWNAVTACAEALRAPGDPRTLPARRVDALTQVCADILAGGGWAGVRLPPTDRGRPRVTVTVPYPVLFGHRAPCELTGHGPICTEQALPLIGAGDLYRILTDPVSGQLLDYGHTRYRPPPHLAEFVKIRDGECPLPSCHQESDRAPIDHIVPAKPDPRTGLPTLGGTSADNLAPPCPHHHNGKDAGRGFTLHRALDGTYTWTTPLGRIYTWKPDPLWHHDTDPIPACDCPPTCPCHMPPAAAQDDDDPPPVTTGDDWADEFLTSREPHNGVADAGPDPERPGSHTGPRSARRTLWFGAGAGAEEPLDRRAARPTNPSTTDRGPSAPPTIAPDLDDDPDDPPF